MQMPLLPSPVERPHGVWADIGRWMVGEGPRPDCLPIPLGTVREVVRACGCRRRERMGAALWVTTGAAGTNLCAAHKSWPVPR